MADHTPGTWEVRHDPEDGWYEWRVYAGDRLVANVLHDTFVNGPANAPLIAAAPDLLAAVEELLERRHEAYIDGNDYGFDHGWDDQPDVIRAKAVVARAKGGS